MKKTAYTIIIILLCVSVAVNIGFFARDAFSIRSNDMPRGKLLFSTMSTDPNQTYTVQIWQIKDEDSVGDAIRAVRINNADSSEKTIYWNINERNALVYWESDYVVVNNDIAIDVRTQSYDWRYPKVLEK